MNINDAIHDKNRPLTISPMEWVRAASANLAAKESQKTAAKKEVPAESTEGAAKPDEKDDEDGVNVIEASVDAMVAAVEQCYDGLQKVEMADLRPEQRAAFNKVKDLMDTAIAPYLADVITTLDALEQE